MAPFSYALTSSNTDQFSNFLTYIKMYTCFNAGCLWHMNSVSDSVNLTATIINRVKMSVSVVDLAYINLLLSTLQ